MTFSSAVTVAGGLGLLLLGMKLMTDGLKLAGGPMLRQVLGQWTRTRVRALLSGFGITAMVQSSAAVTIAAIGFVNAGLMSLTEALWVVFGANVGTTSTAWIVALLGLKVNIKAFALPCIAIGTGLWLAGGVTRRTALGEALAGFGLFFMGIELLQETMGALGSGVALDALPADGAVGLLAYMCVGFLLTFLMQSSSASMALILTATAGGLAPLTAGAAAVIGANVGTTSTAALAAIGATPNAKRLAAAHVVFNVITGAAALTLLFPMLQAILWSRAQVGMSADPLPVLALYHTMFNVLGVLLLWPVSGVLVRYLQNRFRSKEEERGRPKHLDSTVVRTPPLAMAAMILETGRIGESARLMSMTSLRCQGRPCGDLHSEKLVLDSLQRAAAEFSTRMSREGLSPRVADDLPRVLRVTQYWNAAAEAAIEADVFRRMLTDLEDRDLALGMGLLVERGEEVIDLAVPDGVKFSVKNLQEAHDDFERAYQEFKAALLKAGTSGLLSVEQMVARLDYISRLRRIAQQLLKGSLLLDSLRRIYGLSAFDAGEGRREVPEVA